MRTKRPTALGDLLVSLRKRRRVSQETLARQSGVSRAIISILERGYDPSTKKTPHPRPATLRQISHGLAQDGDEQEEAGRAQAYYADLMQAAGYGAIPPATPNPTLDDLMGIDDEADGEPDDVAVSDDFRSELARRYGSENAAFVDEVVRTIKTFPPGEATFVRNMLIGAVHNIYVPWKRRPDEPSEMAELVHAGTPPRSYY